MYDPIYAYLITHMQEETRNAAVTAPAPIHYLPMISFKARMCASLGAALISLGMRLREAGRIKELNFPAEMHQECC